MFAPTGGAVQQNGQTTAEIQEDVPLNTMSSTGSNKRHSTHDKLQIPRASLHAITTLGISQNPSLLKSDVKKKCDKARDKKHPCVTRLLILFLR